MSERVQMLEKAIKELSDSELREFAAWYARFEQQAWDPELQDDAKARPSKDR